MKSFLIAIPLASVLVVSAGGAELPITPTAATQALLLEWMETTTNSQSSLHWAMLGTLRDVAGNSETEFVRQLVYFIYEHSKKYNAGLIHAYALLDYCHVSKLAIAKALGPHLYSRNEEFREVVRVPYYVERGPYRYPDYSDFRQLALGEDWKHEAAEPIRRMMFEFSPNAAFLLFNNEVQGGERLELRRMERFIADALYEKTHLGGLPGGMIDEGTASVIRRLGESEHWWARMFAAEIMVQNKEFRDPEVIDRLLKDENNLVRQSVASIKTPDPLRFAKVDK